MTLSLSPLPSTTMSVSTSFAAKTHEPRLLTHPRQLWPVLCPLERAEQPQLGTHDFGGTIASIAVSAGLRVAFCTAAEQSSEMGQVPLLTHEHLESLGLTALQAWERSRINVVDNVSLNSVSRFSIRPATYILGQPFEGLQLRSNAVATSTFLTHPGLFRSIHLFVTRYFDCEDEEVFYFCPEHNVVLALPASEKRSGSHTNSTPGNSMDRVSELLQQRYGASREFVSSAAFRYERGFPTSSK